MMTHSPRPSPSLFLRRPGVIGLVLATGLVTAGCAQQSTPGYYDPPRASSATDASYQQQELHNRPRAQAASQIQIPLRGADRNNRQDSAETTGEGPVVPSTPATAQLYPEPITFAGTLPCVGGPAQCAAQRITLTLSPNGRWRTRSVAQDNQGHSGTGSIDQGCWQAVLSTPAHVLLFNADGNVQADFSVITPQTLRLYAYGGHQPSLHYNLARQPDLDPIDEAGANAPTCNN